MPPTVQVCKYIIKTTFGGGLDNFVFGSLNIICSDLNGGLVGLEKLADDLHFVVVLAVCYHQGLVDENLTT